MFLKLSLFLAVLVLHQVASQSWDDSTTTTAGSSTTSGSSSTTSGSSSTTSSGSSTASSTSSSGNSTTASSLSGQANNQSSSNATNQAVITQFFGQVLRGEVWGVRKCKKPKDCGLGLRCDLLLNLCVPFNTPILSEIEKPCQNQSECSGLHSCQAGFCRFCGPKSCKSNLDCCGGSFASGGQHGSFFECLNIEDQEKLALARQLGRVPQGYQPVPKVAGGKSPEDAFEVESEELLQLGANAQGDVAMHGKRCWARCNADNDCYYGTTPDDIRKVIGCCNGVCSRRQSCVSASPQAVQQLQLLQQQQQQQLAQAAQQQQLLQQQQQLLQGQQAQPGQQQQGGWASQTQPQQPQQQQVWAQPQIWVQPQPPRPQSWQEAQQQGPSWQQGQAGQQQQG